MGGLSVLQEVWVVAEGGGGWCDGGGGGVGGKRTRASSRPMVDLRLKTMHLSTKVTLTSHMHPLQPPLTPFASNC
jgi:hypothetical protein